MSTAKKIRMLLVEREIGITALARQLGTSPSNISDKLKRDNFCEKDLKQIAEALDFEYDIVFTDKKTGKKF